VINSWRLRPTAQSNTLRGPRKQYFLRLWIWGWKAIRHSRSRSLRARQQQLDDHRQELDEVWKRIDQDRAQLERDSIPAETGHFQILCGERRWRAAREAGLS